METVIAIHRNAQSGAKKTLVVNCSMGRAPAVQKG
jgi:hypothetical protein